MIVYTPYRKSDELLSEAAMLEREAQYISDSRTKKLVLAHAQRKFDEALRHMDEDRDYGMPDHVVGCNL